MLHFFIDNRCELQASRVVVLDNGKKMLYTSIHMPKSFIIAVCSLINKKLTETNFFHNMILFFKHDFIGHKVVNNEKNK